MSLEQTQRMMSTIFINHSEKVPFTKKNQESKRYQESNCRGRENGRESAMPFAFITCHYCKNLAHKVKDSRRKLEKEYEMEKSEKFNHEREKMWCRYHQTNGHSDKQFFQQMEKSQNLKMEGRKNSVACTIARFIQINNAYVRTVLLLLMVKITENMKPLL